MILPSDSSLSLCEVIILLGLKQQFTRVFGNNHMELWMKEGERERAGPQLTIVLGTVTVLQSLFVPVGLNQGLRVLHICIKYLFYKRCHNKHIFTHYLNGYLLLNVPGV